MFVDTMKEETNNFIRYSRGVSSVAMLRLTRTEHYKIKPVWSFGER